MGLDPMTHEIITRAKTKSQMLNLLSHPGAPARGAILISGKDFKAKKIARDEEGYYNFNKRVNSPRRHNPKNPKCVFS